MISNHEVWIIVPGYNEARYIRKVIRDIHNVGFSHVLFSDDGSSDASGRIATEEGAVVLRHIVNMGKGAALKTGCDYAVEHGARYLVVLDADGQHDPKEIPAFLHGLESHDIVFGYRRFNRRMPLVFRIGNSLINAFSQFVTGLALRDTQSGYRAFTASGYRKIRWNALDYSMESEMIVRAGKAGLSYAEVPIKTRYADKYKGTTVLDGAKILFNLLWWRLTR